MPGQLPLWCRIENLLPPRECERMLAAALDEQRRFTPSHTLTSTSGHRRSHILRSNPSFLRDFVKLVQCCLPVVTRALVIAPFEPTKIIAQVTTHNDGDFYRVHDDNGHPDVRHRTISFAFYFHPEPREFSGGELVLYEQGTRRDDPVGASVALEPVGNTIVFFASDVLHAVRPVACPSCTFAKGRFAINGWISRDGAPQRSEASSTGY